MSWWKIAWRSIQQRGVASFLTGLSMALGVMLVVMVLTIHGVVAESFKTGSSVGYDLLIGARGGSTQLVLNTVFYLQQPIETIPYDYYLSFADKETRLAQMRHSAAYQSEVSLNQTMAINDQLGMGFPGGAALGISEFTSANAKNDFAVKYLRLQNDGDFSLYAKMVIPVCLGDTFGADSRFRVVATTPAFFNELEINVDTGDRLGFKEGRAFETWNTENGVFEAVVGQQVAKEENLRIGDVIRPIHGDIASGGHEHRTEFKLVGILERSGTRNDSAVFINLEGFYLMNDHIKPLEDELANMTSSWDSQPDDELADMSDDEFNSRLDEMLDDPEAMDSLLDEAANEESVDAASGESSATVDEPAEELAEDSPAEDSPAEEENKIYLPPLPIEQRELTALLVRGNDPTGAGLMRLDQSIDGGIMEKGLEWSPFRNTDLQVSAQGVNPLREIYGLMELFVNPIQRVLLALTVMICIVSGIAILVSIYNSMSERKQEIAIMRALGADQTTVMGVILAESMLLSLLGGFAGWIGAHLAVGFAAPLIQELAGVHINPLSFAPAISIPYLPGVELSPELLLVPGLMLLSIIVGLVPAIAAYRTDVSENLN